MAASFQFTCVLCNLVTVQTERETEENCVKRHLKRCRFITALKQKAKPSQTVINNMTADILKGDKGQNGRIQSLVDKLEKNNVELPWKTDKKKVKFKHPKCLVNEWERCGCSPNVVDLTKLDENEATNILQNLPLSNRVKEHSLLCKNEIKCACPIDICEDHINFAKNYKKIIRVKCFNAGCTNTAVKPYGPLREKIIQNIDDDETLWLPGDAEFCWSCINQSRQKKENLDQCEKIETVETILNRNHLQGMEVPCSPLEKELLYKLMKRELATAGKDNVVALKGKRGRAIHFRYQPVGEKANISERRQNQIATETSQFRRVSITPDETARKILEPKIIQKEIKKVHLQHMFTITNQGKFTVEDYEHLIQKVGFTEDACIELNRLMKNRGIPMPNAQQTYRKFLHRDTFSMDAGIATSADGKKFPYAIISDVWKEICRIVQNRADSGDLVWHVGQNQDEIYLQFGADHGAGCNVGNVSLLNRLATHSMSNVVTVFLIEGTDRPDVFREVTNLFYKQLNNPPLIKVKFPPPPFQEIEQLTPINTDVELLEFSCSHCNRMFDDERSFQFHVFDKHTDKKGRNFSCKKCSQTFKTKDALKNHSKRHKSYTFTMKDDNPSYSHICQKIQDKDKVYKKIRKQFFEEFEKEVVNLVEI